MVAFTTAKLGHPSDVGDSIGSTWYAGRTPQHGTPEPTDAQDESASPGASQWGVAVGRANKG